MEFPLWAVLFGLATRFAVGPQRPGIVGKWAKSEPFLKCGLILLGFGMNLAAVLKAGTGGIVQAAVMVPSVFLFCWWLSGKLGLSDTLKAVMSTAVSICGVSAAIAAAGAVQAKKQELALITSLVIVTAIPLMALTPFLASAMGLPQPVAGAWFGGNIDTTAAVVGAGTVYGKVAQETASVVKMSQNALIGLVAFSLALWSAASIRKGEKPSIALVWQRFPKFVLGFLAASVLVTLVALPAQWLALVADAKNLLFALAFVCMGWEMDLAGLKGMGARPVVVYLTVTGFNTILALLVALVVFGGVK